MSPKEKQEKTYTTLEEDSNLFLSYPSDKFLEEELLNLLEPEEKIHTHLTFKQVFQSEETREVFTGTYEFFTNPLSVITPRYLQTLYQFLYSIEFEWHPLSDEANDWDSEWSQVSDSTDGLRPEDWKLKAKCRETTQARNSLCT